MSNFDPTGGKDASGRSQVAKRQAGLLSDLAKSLDVQHHNTSLMHAFGEAFEIPAAVTTTTSGTGTVGKAPSPARSDHQHGAEVPTWVYPAMISGWVNYLSGWEGARYCKLGGVVYIQGLIAGGTVGAPCFYLGAGYRPRWNLMFEKTNNSGIHRFDIYADGAVMQTAGTNGFCSITLSFVPG